MQHTAIRIAVLDDYHELSKPLAGWRELEPRVTVFTAPIPETALVETLRDFDVICVMRERTPFPAKLIESLPNLRLIVTTGPRNASIDVKAAKARGVMVCGTESRAAATAHLVMTLILVGVRNLSAEMNTLGRGGWQAYPGRDLDGLTLGLVGLGRLGAQVANLARPFGVRMLAWSQNLTDERCAELGVERAPDLHSLLSQSDAVSIHLVLSERTRGLIGAAELAAMKPDALLVNTSRGPIVDNLALRAALHAGRPCRAALDVYETEPLPRNDPLRDQELIGSGRLILTPHVGYGSLQTFRLMHEQTADAVRAWLDGAPIRQIA